MLISAIWVYCNTAPNLPHKIHCSSATFITSSQTVKMATVGQTTLQKEKKDESFLDKISTIARKKKVKEGRIV